MRIGEFAQQAGVTVKAVRYYEQLGLIAPARETNGYRSFDRDQLRAVIEVRKLSEIGITPVHAAPFLECLKAGHQHGDSCASSLAIYRDAIADLDRTIAALSHRRDRLQRRLDSSAARGFAKESRAQAFTSLPSDLPEPQDDGAADHLAGLPLPEVSLPASDGASVSLRGLGRGRSILYFYPLTGRPGVDLPEGWDAIPGARGCSTEACNFRDHFAQLHEAGATHVFGVSSQHSDYQAEVASRLRLPFTMLSDERFQLADELRLPVFAAPGHARLYKRLTLVVADGVIEKVFYPIFPPNTHAQQVLDWLQSHPTQS